MTEEEILSSTFTGADSQQHNNQLYCGYCNTDCKTPAGLVVHCKQNRHKYAVFADSGRDVLWQFESPPPNMKKDEISPAQHSYDKAVEWNTRCKHRTAARKVKELPFGLMNTDNYRNRDLLTYTIIGLETKLQCSYATADTYFLKVNGLSEKVTWTLEIKGNQTLSFRGVRFKEESIFKLAQVFHCSTNQVFESEKNKWCSPDNKPGLLLGLVKVNFYAIPEISDVYENEILIDVGFSKFLSIPVKLRVVTTKLSKCLKSGKLLLDVEGIFSGSNLRSRIKEMFPSPISLEDKALISKYSEQLKQAKLYTNDCAILLESTDQANYYEKLCTLLNLEGDHKRRLIQRVSKKEISAKLTFIKGPPSLEVKMQDLGDEKLGESISLLRSSPSILLQFLSENVCPGAKSYIWECNKELTDDGILLIQLPPSFPRLLRLDGECFSIAFEFSDDLTYLAKCHAAVEHFKHSKLDYLLIPSNQTHYPTTKSFKCQPPLKKMDTELNSQQVLAMEAILLSESVLPVVIAGAFGTGKTFLLSQAAEYLVKHHQEPFVLVCALNNSAADVYLDNFNRIIPSNSKHKILRLSYKGCMVTTVPRHLHKYYLFDSPDNARFCYPSESGVKKYRIIVTTVGMAQELLKLNLTGHFTHIFIDEAAQMTIPEVMMALSLASNTTKVVLAGDHMQMNPKVYCPLAQECNLHKSPLEHIYNEYSDQELDKHKILLTCNYRTHKDILILPSQFFYRSKLKSCNGMIQKHPTCGPLMLLKCDGQETYSTEFYSYYNVDEADKIIHFLKETLLPKWPEELWGKLEENDKNIAILTTEYAQVRYIRSCLEKERMPMIYVNTHKNAQGFEFRVVILSVVRTHHSIDKDLTNQCSFYTESRILNCAFARVQSLIVTAAHPLSLITRGHMTCRLFWASYLSESLTKKKRTQLKKEFTNERKFDNHTEKRQLSPEDNEVCCLLIQNDKHISTNKIYYDQILDDLEKEYDSDDNKSVISTSSSEKEVSSEFLSQSNVSSNVNSSVETSDYSGQVSSSTSNNTNPLSRRTSGSGPYKAYDSNRLLSDQKLFTVTTTKRCESGYALVLNPAEKDIRLASSSALNRSLRGDTVAIDKLGSTKGRVVANECNIHGCHPKKFLVCHCEKYTNNRLVPIDPQYPKIHIRQKVKVSKSSGLKIFVEGLDSSDTEEIPFYDINKFTYLVWLNPDWAENCVYPAGVPVKCFYLDDDMETFFNILKYNYIPGMPSYDYDNEEKGGFSYEIIDYVAKEFPKNIENEIQNGDRYVYNDVFTIDDEETVVLDDALSLGFDQDQNFIVNVHIADASYFVEPGSVLDRAALERGKSFYINYGEDRAIFMLPNDICIEHGSLQAGKKRLAVTTQFVFSKEDYSLLSPLSDVEVHRSIVCSVCRLTKEDVGKFLLENSMDKPVNMSTEQFSKLKRDLYFLGKIATKLKQSQWPDSYLYEPDRGKQDKYSMAGSSLVEMFMCLCNTAIPAKLLKRDELVGPVLVQTPIKHHKQQEWLENHLYHLYMLDCCPLLKRMISTEVLESFNQNVEDNEALSRARAPSQNRVLTISQENWNRILDLAERSDGRSLATYLCSLHNFPELFVAYRQLCKSRSKSFYDVIPDQSEASNYKHSHFNDIYTHFTSPLRRYCDILVHRAVLGPTSLPSDDREIRGLLHKINIHKWDESEFSRRRNTLYFIDCCRKETKTIAVTTYVGKITNKLLKLHAPPELQDFLPDRVCEIKLSHLQAEGKIDEHEHVMTMKWEIEIIPAPGNELTREDIESRKECLNVVKLPVDTLAEAIKAVHCKDFSKAKSSIKSCKTEKIQCEDVKQENTADHEGQKIKKTQEIQFSHKLTITKHIREYGGVLDVQFSSTQEKPYAIEPTVNLVHISQTFACCLLHVEHPIECYAPNILKFYPGNLKKAKDISHYVKLWRPAIEAESITGSILSKRIPLIIKGLRLKWTSNNSGARFTAVDYEDYKIKFQNPFSVNDYVCAQYRGLLPNPSSEKFDLDRSKKVTWVAHGRIVMIQERNNEIKIKFAKNTNPPISLSKIPCDLEIIPFQVTFSRIHAVFEKMSGEEYNNIIEKICCRQYIVDDVDDEDDEDDEDDTLREDGGQLNAKQREAVGKALKVKNKLLLIQGPPGTGKTKTCVELLKCFVNLNYDKKSPQTEGPTILYCAPSNKAVNVGACALLKNYPGVSLLRVYGTGIEYTKPGLGAIPYLLGQRNIAFENDEDDNKVPQVLEEHSLHFKIRNESSTKYDIKNFIKFENWLKTKSISELLKDYKNYKALRDTYYELKKSAENVVIEDAQVIFCTCAEAGSNRISTCTKPPSNQINTRTVKQCIIDECGMCTEPETLLPMILSEKIILVGDHKQLQPVVISKTAEFLGLKISMFQRLFKDEKMSRYCIMLTKQYRMHPSIRKFPSSQFYDGKLEDDDGIQKRSLKWSGKLPPDIWKQSQTQRCVFIHVEGDEEISGIDTKGSYTASKSNEMEAKKVEFVIKNLLKNVSKNDIMVLTPYRAQINCCLKEFKQSGISVVITTIHGSQGRECDVVILTTVRSLPEEDIPDHPSHSWVNENLGFLTDEHLMNVAITRAKEALCIIGNKKLLEKHQMWKSLLDHYKKHNCII